MNTNVERPDTLGELLTLALDECDKLDRERYFAVSGVWHEQGHHQGYDDKRCCVCLAGGIIAGTLGADPDTNVYHLPDVGDDSWRDALIAVDYARRGLYRDAYAVLHGGSLVPCFLLDDAETGTAMGGFVGWDEYDGEVDRLRAVAERFIELGV